MSESAAEAFGVFEPTQPQAVPLWMFGWRKRRAEGLPAIRLTDGTIYYGHCGGHVAVIDHFGLDVDAVVGIGFILFEKRGHGLDGSEHARCVYAERREGAGGYVTVAELRTRVRARRPVGAPGR